MFVNRVSELKLLEKRYASGKAEFFVLYGRRRGGKAELLGRVFGPIFDELLKIVKKRINPSTYQEIADEFASYRDLKFSEFSE